MCFCFSHDLPYDFRLPAARTDEICGILPLLLLPTENVFIEVEMAINAEFSDYTVITEADPIFIVAEVLFCIFFTVELVIRCLVIGQEPQLFVAIGLTVVGWVLEHEEAASNSAAQDMYLILGSL